MAKSDNDVVIDWIDVVRDMPAILALEEKNEGAEGWPEELFLEELSSRNVCGFTAKKSERLLGFYVYFLSKESILILNMQIETELTAADGEAALRALLNKLKAKLGKGLRTSITILVKERKLSLQQALRREGFRATEIMRNYFSDTEEDGYLFVYEEKNLEVSMAKGFMKNLQ
jgi:[ribosomal protein S18]-alanine N-acetyltransferase